MKRTSLGVISILAVASLALAGCSSTSSSSASSADAKQTITLFTDSDVNVQALWQKTLIPEYEKAHPNITLKFTSADPSTDTTQLAKLAASVKTKRAPAMDVVIDAGFLPDADTAGLLTPITTKNVPGVANVDSSVIPGKGEMPYRGSGVVPGSWTPKLGSFFQEQPDVFEKHVELPRRRVGHRSVRAGLHREVGGRGS